MHRCMLNLRSGELAAQFAKDFRVHAKPRSGDLDPASNGCAAGTQVSGYADKSVAADQPDFYASTVLQVHNDRAETLFKEVDILNHVLRVV